MALIHVLNGLRRTWLGRVRAGRTQVARVSGKARVCILILLLHRGQRLAVADVLPIIGEIKVGREIMGSSRLLREVVMPVVDALMEVILDALERTRNVIVALWDA